MENGSGKLEYLIESIRMRWQKLDVDNLPKEEVLAANFNQDTL